MSPELVAPIVAYLCHENCPVSGEIYVAGGGPLLADLHRRDPGLRATTATRRRSRTSPPTGRPINDETDYYVPVDLPAWAAEYMKHLT